MGPSEGLTCQSQRGRAPCASQGLLLQRTETSSVCLSRKGLCSGGNPQHLQEGSRTGFKGYVAKNNT